MLLNAQQQTNFYATLFYNSTNNTITTTYYINNTDNGNCKMKVAVLPLEMQWNPAVLTLQSFTFIPSGQDLDIWGEENSSKPDVNSSLSPKTVTVNSVTKTFNRTFYRRSTNLCDNTLDLPCGAYLPVFQAVFTISPALASTYNYTDPSATTYIGEFIGNSSGTPSNEYKELTYVANRLFDQAGSDGTCPAGGTVGQINNVPNAQGGEIFVNPQSPLPVVLKSFDVTKMNNKVQLSWETASEISNTGFEVERKTGAGFEKIGFVPSKAINGNSGIQLDYDFTDAAANSNSVIFYRLKLVGYAGKNAYSDVKAVSNQKFLQVMIYPNPSNGKVNVVLPGANTTVDINMIDFSGRLVQSWRGYKGPNVTLNGLQRGIYTLMITDRQSGEKVSQKITVQ